ncbi:MAG: DinB family protein [Anaerolineales bacterium]
MTLTLLLDLDDTLLINNMETFLPAYFQSLGKYMAHHESPQRFISTLTNAAGAMIANDQPDRTLQEAFNAAFFPILGLNAEQVTEDYETFYLNEFPSLQPLTNFSPKAHQLVKDALNRDFTLVIATNPLFPRIAIEERMRWAGISTKDIPIKLITSFETFHFSKPNLAYYAEILARLGWPERASLMVGDDLENDILPANRLGIPAFWVKPDGAFHLEEHYSTPLATGSIDQIIPWLDQIPIEELQPSFNYPDAYLAVLKSTPACLASFFEQISNDIWKQKPQEGEWCLTEIICHLRDVEKEVNLPRLKKAIQELNPFLPGMDTDPWANERQYIQQDGPIALSEFVQARLETLELFNSLSSEDWIRPVRHAIFGPTQLEELAKINAGHDRMHVRQVYQTLKALNIQP